ncbi:MAG: hypothetical protein PF448_07210, partial [Bacteroidales bacterium]|nr:hypothetical protein [Bacteroidales bacterium]
MKLIVKYIIIVFLGVAPGLLFAQNINLQKSESEYSEDISYSDEELRHKLDKAKELLPSDWGQITTQEQSSNIAKYNSKGELIVNKVPGMPGWSQREVDNLRNSIHDFKLHIENMEIALGMRSGEISLDFNAPPKKFEPDYTLDTLMLVRSTSALLPVLGDYIGQAITRKIDFTDIISFDDVLMNRRGVSQGIFDALCHYESIKNIRQKMYDYKYFPSNYAEDVQNYINQHGLIYNDIFNKTQQIQSKATPSGYYEHYILPVGATWLPSWDAVLAHMNWEYEDDSYLDHATGLPFRFYERLNYSTNTSVRVSTNGYVTFYQQGGGAVDGTDWTNDAITSTINPDGALFGFWDDLVISDSDPETNLTDAIFVNTSGAAPNREFTCEFWVVTGYNQAEDTQDDYTFQIKIFEADGSIEYHYPVNGATYNGYYIWYQFNPNIVDATVGIEDYTGANGDCGPNCSNSISNKPNNNHRWVPIDLGHHTNPEIVSCGNTYSRRNDYYHLENQVSNYTCSGWNESGPEYWFSISMPYGSILDVDQVSSGCDLDYFLTTVPGSSSCYDGNYGSTGFTAEINSTDNYYVSVDGYNGNHCEFTIDFNCVYRPTSLTASDNNICEGTSVNLNVSGGGGAGAEIRWFTGSCEGTLLSAYNGQSSISVSPSSTTTYYAAYFFNGAYTSCVSTTINVTPNPPNDDCADATNIGSLPYNSGVMNNICATTDVPAGIGCGTFGKNVWFEVTGTGNLMGASTVNPGTDFDTELHIFSGSCDSLTEITCNDDAVGLQSTATWCSNSGTTYYISVGYYYNISSGGEGNYELTVIDYPVSSPTGISASPSAICNGGNTVLSASPGNNGNQIYWYTGSCGGSFIGSGNSLTVSPTSTTTYYARTYNSACGNFSSSCASVTVIVNPSPTADAGANETICIGGSVTIGGSPTGSGSSSPYSYSWSPSTGLSSTSASNPTASPSSTTTYTVVVTDNNGCTASDNVTVTVNPTPTADAGSNASICNGENVSIGGSPTASGGSGPYNYSWSPSTGLSSTSASNPTASPSSTTTYTVVVTDNNGCTASDNVTVTVIPQETPTFNQLGPYCVGDAPGALPSISTNGISGTWSPATISTASDGNTTYTFTPDAGECAVSTTMDVTVNPIPDPSITPQADLCENDAAVALVAADVGGTWSGTGVSGNSFDPSVAGAGDFVVTYDITVGTCSDSDNITIHVDAMPDASITPAGPYCVSDAAVILTAADAGGTWSGTGITNATTGEFDPSVADAGSHVITYDITNGVCTDTDNITIDVVDIPDASITPQADLCENDAAVALVAVDAGGTWSGTGVSGTSFDPSSAGPGDHVITYDITVGTCSDSDNITIHVDAMPDATITPAGPYCVSDAAVILTA